MATSSATMDTVNDVLEVLRRHNEMTTKLLDETRILRDETLLAVSSNDVEAFVEDSRENRDIVKKILEADNVAEKSTAIVVDKNPNGDKDKFDDKDLQATETSAILQEFHENDKMIVTNISNASCEKTESVSEHQPISTDAKENSCQQTGEVQSATIVEQSTVGPASSDQSVLKRKLHIENIEELQNKSTDSNCELGNKRAKVDNIISTSVNDVMEQSPIIINNFAKNSTEEIMQIIRNMQQRSVIGLQEIKTAEQQEQKTEPAPIVEQLTEEEKVHDAQLRKSCETFLQHLPCFKLQANNSAVPCCRECSRRNNAFANGDKTTTDNDVSMDVYCRFYEFRRLQYTADGELRVSGFPNPYLEPTQENFNIWQPDENTEPTSGWMDIQVCRYILLHVGDQFCYLWRQEAEALDLHENPDKTIAWKKAVKDLREICDVCETTLFNYHWTCSKCGFSVCLDCFKDRKENRTMRKLTDSGKSDKFKKGRDELHWFLCTEDQKHELPDLMLTQIIAGDALNVLGRLLHEVRKLWQIPQMCDCLLSNQELPAEAEQLNDLIIDMIKDSQLKQHTSASSLATEETKRQQKRLEQMHNMKMQFALEAGIDYVPGRIYTKETLGPDPITTAFDNFKHINFQREGLAGLRRFLPPQVMTLTDSTMKAPGVAHEWLCDGKLLRLTNPVHPDNRILFQEVWKCGQPVMISEVANSLNLDLWHPEAFCIDFGDKPNDLINCLNGNLVPNQPMRYFWEGFQCIRKRLLDHHGQPMLLKLKDWPPGDDFAEIMPSRYADLMKGLPMPEYTLRSGNLNLASCLPKMFVPPDLGPKMYNAYGSALYPDKGTTNLHLDISDAVNIMVYVGIPTDAESIPQLSATQNAIAISGCDFLTRYRCQRKDVLPGAIWHIFAARDADKIRDLLNRVTLEKGFRLEPDHDPIHDQNWYLDDKLRTRLFKEYGVKGYSIVQCLGDAVFIPAGAPHQVQNLHNCIKVAEDFVSPENITHCYHLTHEFRRLSNSHTNHEDKLQIKNIIYHSIKDCCTILMRALHQRLRNEIAKQEE